MESVEKERMEQILRVDVSALLKTIQNLENKLSQSPAPVNIPIAGDNITTTSITKYI
jgi:hypothetical protein